MSTGSPDDPSPLEDRSPFEELISAELHGAAVPSTLRPDLDAARDRGRRVVRRRRIATAVGGAAAVLALGVGAATLTSFGPQTAPPASTTSDAPREGVVELTVGGQNGADEFEESVRAEVRPRGSSGTVTFTHHDGEYWAGNAQVTIRKGDEDAMTRGDGAGGHLTYGVVHEEPTEVTLLDAEGQDVRTVDFASAQLPGTGRYILVATRDAQDVMSVPESVRWTAADGEVFEVPVEP